MKDKLVGTVTIHEIADMSERKRKNVVNWLRKLAGDILRNPNIFSKRFQARYFCQEREGSDSE